jgi:HlyD family type I secretion membrane fusion protein
MTRPDLPVWTARTPTLVGLIAVTGLFLGLGVWGTQTRIAGAVVAHGMIQVESLRQVVQHPDGGVVGTINVTDGDRVEAGDVLIRFDDTLLLSEIAIVNGQLTESMARKDRLHAERDGSDDVVFSAELVERAKTDPKVADLISDERQLFRTRLEFIKKETEQLAERKIQIEGQIAGTEAQLAATRTQGELIAQELADQQKLFDQGLTQATRVLSLRREEARLMGELGDLKSIVARGNAQLIETDIEILKLQSQRQQDALAELRDIEFRMIELTQRLLSAQETLSRMDVRAPVSGVVHGMTVHALRSVVKGAEPILYIVPQDSPMLVKSRIDSIHIDQIHVGQEAALRFSTFDQRSTPQVSGHITKVSADVFTDEVTGLNYYSADIIPVPEELEKLGDVELLPGMPVEAFIKTGERTPLSYLAKPMADYFNRAFREK